MLKVKLRRLISDRHAQSGSEKICKYLAFLFRIGKNLIKVRELFDCNFNPKRVLLLIYLQIQNQKIIREGEKFRRNAEANDSPDFEYQLKNVRITGEADDFKADKLQVIENIEIKDEVLEEKKYRKNDVQIVKVNS